MNVAELLLVVPVLLFSVILHEVAHGWVALKEGDPTAYMLGRLTLNPLPHIDPIGSVVLPLLLWLSPGHFMFGWAKPVPVNPRNFRRYRRGDIMVSLAGVSANILLAAAFTVVAVGVGHLGRAYPGALTVLTPLQSMATAGIVINLILAFFNLIPIPPLDGSHVFYYLLPARLGAAYRRVGWRGMLVLMGLLFFVPSVTRIFLWPALFLFSQARSLIPPLS